MEAVPLRVIKQQIADHWKPREYWLPNVIPIVRRNEPCPCGSGRKYKQCHGKRGIEREMIWLVEEGLDDDED